MQAGRPVDAHGEAARHFASWGFIVTTQRDARQRPAPDLVNRKFVATGPNQVWVADMTYVPTWAGFIFLAMVLDVWSRRVVGWAIGEQMTTDLVLSALNMAITQREPDGVIHHSDQGSQYTSIAFGERCAKLGVRPSMGSVGDAYDNAMRRASLLASSANCSIAVPSRARPKRASRSSAISKADTTRDDDMPALAGSHQPSSSAATRPNYPFKQPGRPTPKPPECQALNRPPKRVNFTHGQDEGADAGRRVGLHRALQPDARNSTLGYVHPIQFQQARGA